MTVAPNGTLYVMGYSATTGYVLMGTPGASSWTVIGTVTGTPASAAWMALGADGALYVSINLGGATLNPGNLTLPCVARWTGGGWTYVASGSSTTLTVATSLAFDGIGRLHIAGQIATGSSIGQLVPGTVSSSKAGYVVWDGSSTHQELAALSSTNAGGSVAVNPNDQTVFLITPDTPANTSYVVPTTVSYQGTAPTPCRFTFKCGATATWVGGIRNERTGQAIYFTGLLLAANETLTVDTTPGASSVTTDWRGTMASYVAPMSNLADFVLLEGENYLSVLTSTALSSATVTWYNRHYGIDGAGSNIGTATFEAN